MKQVSEETMVKRLRLAFELFESGVEMMQKTLRRHHPNSSDEEIEKKIFEWLRTRPGATHGDTVGRLIPCPTKGQNK
jgi:Rv0078B-related antitoxin